MTLHQVRLRTMDLIRKMRFQLRRQGHEGGMSDEEFIENVLEPFETELYQDRQIEKMARHNTPPSERRARP